MQELRSASGRLVCYQQDDGNFVVYDSATMQPVFDEWSWLLAQGKTWGDPTPTAPPVVAPPTTVEPGSPIRVTDERDGELLNRGYSYWSQAWIGPDGIYVFCGHTDGRPRFFRVSNGTVERLGPSMGYGGTSEGWYWDRDGGIYLCDGPRLRNVHPFNGTDRIVVDITDSHPGCRLWQAHSSDDGRVHSATVQHITTDGPYQSLGSLAVVDGEQHFFPARGTLDESQITSDGAFLIIKEDNDNRIINLLTRETRMLRDADGAVGHSDCGEGFVIGEDDQHGACVLWDLRQPLTPERRSELFKTWNMGHVSVRGNRCLLSGAVWLSNVALDGSGSMPLAAHGMTGEGYDYQVFANLDPSGRVVAYMSNAAGRLDLYLLPL